MFDKIPQAKVDLKYCRKRLYTYYHVGSAKYGFIKGAQHVFQSKSSSDYYQEINSDVFSKWSLYLFRGLEES